MDALSDVLRAAHLTGGVFLHAEFFAPWCLAARISPEHCAPVLGPASHLIIYHYVVEGEFRLQLEGDNGEGLVIGAGEIVLLPHNDLHLMGSDLRLPPVAGTEIIRSPKNGGLFSIHHGGNGKRTRMVCGFLGCAKGEGNPVISSLPALLRLNVEQGAAAEWIRSTFHYAAEEVAAGRPGSETVLAKLSELLFVETVRRHAEVPAGRPDGMVGRFARSLRCAGIGAVAPRHRPALDGRGPWPRNRLVAIRVGRPLHSLHRRSTHALSCRLAHADGDREAPEHQWLARTNSPNRRLRVGSSFLSRVQESIRRSAGHMAARERMRAP